jgi:hypothetical protein
MTILQSLLSKGYFPKEIPPAFSTESFANLVTGADFVADHCLLAPNLDGKLKHGKSGTSSLCKHNLGMLDRTSRPLHIPHPVHFYYLCKSLNDGWNDIKVHLSKSNLSISTPEPDSGTLRAFSPKETGEARLNRRIQDRVHGDFLIVADVANCYGSIYTHSIPWALHTKSTAKGNRKDFNLIGNQIDVYVRNGQDGQTVGVPVGSDTSFIIAETILTAVDYELQDKHSGVIGFRFYDDYEIVCSDYGHAHQTLADLEACLAEYELSLNRRKTCIVALPDELNYPWLSELRKFDFENYEDRSSVKKRELLMDFANAIFTMANKFPNDPILRYALVTLASEPNATYDWEIYQNLLIQIYRSQPRVSHLITHELLLYTEIQRKTLNKQLLAKAISDHILRYARTRASNEVAWAMWLAILFNLKLGQEVTDTISSSSDNFVAILAMDADSRGLFDKPIDSSLWERKLLEENIYTEDWLLVYEKFRHKVGQGSKIRATT